MHNRYCPYLATSECVTSQTEHKSPDVAGSRPLTLLLLPRSIAEAVPPLHWDVMADRPKGYGFSAEAMEKVRRLRLVDPWIETAGVCRPALWLERWRVCVRILRASCVRLYFPLDSGKVRSREGGAGA